MLFSQNRSDLRAMYMEAWRKRREGLPMEPLEIQIADLIAEHPEYHKLLESEDCLDRDWSPESGEGNPFMHLGMHVAIREQVATDRPAGVTRLFETARKRAKDAHEVEHRFIECLGSALWEVMRYNRPFDEKSYLECLAKKR